MEIDVTSNIFWFFFELAINFIECVAFLILPIAVLGLKGGKKKDIIWFVLFLIILITSEYLYEIAGAFHIFFFMAFISLYSVFALRGSMAEKLTISLFTCTISTLVNSVSIFSCSFIMDIQISNLFARSVPRIIVMLTSKLLLILSVILMIKFSKNNSNLQLKQWISIGVSFAIADVASSFLLNYAATVRLTVDQEFIFAAVALCIFLKCALTFFTFARLSKENDIKNENKLLLQEKKYQERNLATIMAGNDEINHIKHDLKSYLLIISRLMSEKKYDAAMKECNVVTRKVDKVATLVVSDSILINLMINEKLGQCKAQNINVKCVSIYKLSILNESDFAVVFSNLMDNAIEYSAKLPNDEGKIEINIAEKMGFITLTISNYILKPVLKNNPTLETTKTDSVLHGIGHKSVESIVSSHGGIIKYYETNNTFTVSVAVPIGEL